MRFSDIFFCKKRGSGTKYDESHFISLFNKLEDLIDREPSILKDSLSLNNLSKMVGTNRTYLSNSIKVARRCSFSHYIAEKRVNYSITLVDSFILERDFSLIDIDNISDLSGFGSRRSYVTYFKRIMGVYPSQYIKRRYMSTDK